MGGRGGEVKGMDMIRKHVPNPEKYPVWNRAVF